MSLLSLSHPCHPCHVPVVPTVAHRARGGWHVVHGPSSVYAPSTPWAAACEAGGAWGVICGWSAISVLWCLGWRGLGRHQWCGTCWGVRRCLLCGYPTPWVSLCHLSPSYINTPHILFWQRGGWHRHQWVWVVSCLSIITSRLEPRKQRKQISKFIKKETNKTKNLHRAQTMQSSFGPMVHPFTFLQLLVIVVEVGVDLGMVVVVGRRMGGRWQCCQQWWLMLMWHIHHVMCWGWALKWLNK